MKATLLALALTCLTLIGSTNEINGTWIVDQPTPSGNRGGSMDPSTYEFKVSGTTLTGSIQRPAGPNAFVPIDDGNIDGDSFTFTTTQHGLRNIVHKLNYTGTIVGDKIQLSIGPGDQRTTVMLKRGSWLSCSPQQPCPITP